MVHLIREDRDDSREEEDDCSTESSRLLLSTRTSEVEWEDHRKVTRWACLKLHTMLFVLFSLVRFARRADL